MLTIIIIGCGACDIKVVNGDQVTNLLHPTQTTPWLSQVRSHTLQDLILVHGVDVVDELGVLHQSGVGNAPDPHQKELHRNVIELVAAQHASELHQQKNQTLSLHGHLVLQDVSQQGLHFGFGNRTLQGALDELQTELLEVHVLVAH